MTQPNGGPNSARGFISAAARSKRVKEAAQKDKRTARANLTPWQQALLYENRANPYPFYAELRKTPVSQQPNGSYVVSTYREIVSILHDPRVSSDLSRDSLNDQRIDGSLLVQGGHGCMDGAVEGVGVSEGVMGQMVRLEIVPDNLDV